ncbi:MptD family putative ECF transporter S component, partial [Streptococcus suis]
MARFGNYMSQWRNLWSYVIFSFGNLGPIFLMWFMRDAYIQKLLERGKDMAYVKEVMVDFTLGNVLYLAG